MGVEPFKYFDGTFSYTAPNIIGYKNRSYDITDPEQVNTLLHQDQGNVDCILDQWLLRNLPPRWAMHCMCHVYPDDAQAAAFALGTDLRGNPKDTGSPVAQHDWIADLYRGDA